MDLSNNEDIEQLLSNPKFRQWVVNPTVSLDRYWAEWRLLYPEREEVFWLAKEAILILAEDSLPISEEWEAINIQRILNETKEREEPTSRRLYWLSVAASVLILSAFFGYTWLQSKGESGQNDIQEAFLSRGQAAWITFTNSQKSPGAVTLPDGSTAIVFPSSSIRYPEKFSDTTRNVILSGEAFFEVTKDAAHPFIVSTTHLSTRVLGTSFRVRDVVDETPLVRVKTGKVEVTLTEKKNGSGSETLILSAHQEMSFKENQADRLPDIVDFDSESLEALPIETNNYNFKRTPLSQVFQTLRETYGVEIHYDKEKLVDCSLTATLGDQPMQEKLRMISLGLNLHFEINTDNSVTITGNGCR
jgi:transmembrane sensor